MIRAFNLKKFLSSVAYPLIGGGISALITSGSMNDYLDMPKPPLSPPGWLFPIVWSILYIVMGISLYIIREQARPDEKQSAVRIFSFQLIINLLWPILFFSFKLCTLSAIWLALLIALVLFMIAFFYKINRLAAILQIPYLIWCLFALYLNIGICVLS